MSRPFDEARYKGLLEGLDCSEVRSSDLDSDGATQRIDSEFFSKRYLHNVKKLTECSFRNEKLGDVTTKIDVGHVGSMVHAYSESGVPLLLTQNISQFSVGYSDCVKVTPKFHASLRKSQVFPGDCLIARSGSIGNTALVLEEDPQPLNSADIIIVRGDSAKITNGYLVGFLNSRLGVLQIERLTSGGLQGHINLKAIEYVVIPLPSKTFQDVVDTTVRHGMGMYREAEGLQGQAEQTLLRALRLENWQPPEPLTYTRRASEAFTAGRLDSDYFAPRVAELLQKLGVTGLNVGAVAPTRHERFSPDIEGEFDYIEIGNVHADGTVGAERLPQTEAPSRATSYVRAGDVITSSVRPIRRLSAIITQEQDGFVCSSGFVVLQPCDVPAEVLLTYLRLPPLCELMDLHTSASLYPAISETDLLALPFHPIAKDAEAEIVNAVQSAHAARRQAHSLLEAAKRAVEIAIEESEAAALAYLAEFLPANA